MVRRGIESERISILASADAGATWTWLRPGSKARMLDITAVGSRCVWVVGVRGRQGFILRNTDGGETWREQPLAGHMEPHDVVFADTLHSWLLATDMNP